MIPQDQKVSVPSQISLEELFLADPTGLAVEELEKQVREALRATGYFVAVPCDVNVHVLPGRCVELTGVVPSYFLKQQAQVAALSVENVRSLQNDLVVFYQSNKHSHTGGNHDDHFI